MIKVQNGIATREPIPDFLIGLAPETLLDLSWTDPQLNVQDCVWWPEIDESQTLGEFEKYADEMLVVDAAQKVVYSVREVIPMTEEERLPILLQIQAEIIKQTQQRLDDFAATRNYDGILSAATYATSTVPKFQAEGQYAVAIRDSTWNTLYQILAEVQTGIRPPPTSYKDIEEDLPTLAWPT